MAFNWPTILDAMARTYRLRSLSLESDRSWSAHDKHKGPAARMVSFHRAEYRSEIRLARSDPHLALFILFPFALAVPPRNLKSISTRSKYFYAVRIVELRKTDRSNESFESTRRNSTELFSTFYRRFVCGIGLFEQTTLKKIVRSTFVFLMCFTNTSR